MALYRRIVGYDELMHLHNYMLTANNSFRIKSMTDHPRVKGRPIFMMVQNDA